jgi:hypothetical protein
MDPPAVSNHLNQGDPFSVRKHSSFAARVSLGGNVCRGGCQLTLIRHGIAAWGCRACMTSAHNVLHDLKVCASGATRGLFMLLLWYHLPGRLMRRLNVRVFWGEGWVFWVFVIDDYGLFLCCGLPHTVCIHICTSCGRCSRTQHHRQGRGV